MWYVSQDTTFLGLFLSGAIANTTHNELSRTSSEQLFLRSLSSLADAGIIHFLLFYCPSCRDEKNRCPEIVNQGNGVLDGLAKKNLLNDGLMVLFLVCGDRKSVV